VLFGERGMGLMRGGYLLSAASAGVVGGSGPEDHFRDWNLVDRLR
jgi:hypothetical protein